MSIIFIDSENDLPQDIFTKVMPVVSSGIVYQFSLDQYSCSNINDSNSWEDLTK